MRNISSFSKVGKQQKATAAGEASFSSGLRWRQINLITAQMVSHRLSNSETSSHLIL